MNTPTFRPVNQHWVNPDSRNPTQRAPSFPSDPTRAPPRGPRGWSRHRPTSPRVVIPPQKPRYLSHMDKRRQRGSRRNQPPREAKLLPSIEQSAQKGPFDPYAFLSHPPTPSVRSPSSKISTTPEHCRSVVSPQDRKMIQPHSPSLRPKEQSFGHRQSMPFRCSPRKYGLSGPFAEWTATEKTNPALALDLKTVAISNDSNEVKREESIAMTPVIRHTSVAASLQNTQAREQKLKENGVVELDRDEFALQRFLKVQGELTDLEAILIKGKKRHIFEQIKRNAATKSLRGVEKILAENEATPTPSGRPTSLQEGTIVDTRTKTSQRGPASTQDAPSASISSKEKTDRSQKDLRSDHGAIHSSKRYVFDLPEGPRLQEKSQPAPPPKPPKRKELPGMGLIFNPRPNPPQEARKHQNDKLPRDLQRREVNISEVKDTIERRNEADIENAIDSAQNWLRRENALEKEARAKRWEADPNWKRLTADQVEAMRRQASIPPAKFYGHLPKWRPPPGGRQPATMETPTITLAEAEDILAKVKRDQALRLLRRTKDMDSELASSKFPHSKDGKETSHNRSEEKIQSSTGDGSKHSSTIGTKDLSMPKATSRSPEEKKDVIKAVGHEVDSQRSMKDGRPAVESQVKAARDTVEPSKAKGQTRKRKRNTDVSETAVTASTMKNVSESPDLPSTKTMIEGSQMADTSSPIKKKKSKKSSGPEAVEDVVNGAKEPSTPPRSKKRKKAKESMEQHEVVGEGTPTKMKKRKKSGHTQESEEVVVGNTRPETLFDRLKKMKEKREKALALQEANAERLQSTIPTPEASKTKNLDSAPPTAPEPTVEDAWQPMLDDEDPPSPPQPSPSIRKKHKSKRHRQANTPPAIAVDDTTPETIESPAPASPSSEPTHASFNHLRRRHQSLPLRLTPNTTPPTANPNSLPSQPQPPPNLYDLNVLAIHNRLSNLEAAVAAAPAPPNPNALTPLAARKLRLPPLPRATPPGTTRLSDAELIGIGKRINPYERHTGAPYAFSWRGRMYAQYDYLLDWVDDRGRLGWDCKEKARLKTS